MTARLADAPHYHEATEIHSRLVKCPLVIEDSRAYWERVVSSNGEFRAQQAFDEYWFGAKSLSWIKVLILNFHSRFDTFPESLEVLGRWTSMTPNTRAIICHWHLQLMDPLYRAFSGEFLIARRETARPELHRDTVISWIGDNGRKSWTMPTRAKLATRLLSVALSAGLVEGRRDPRQLCFPRVGDEALSYLLYLLRHLTFKGSLLSNPYLRSIGLEGAVLEARLYRLSSLTFNRNGDVFEFDWRYQNLGAWFEAEINCGGVRSS